MDVSNKLDALTINAPKNAFAIRKAGSAPRWARGYLDPMFPTHPAGGWFPERGSTAAEHAFRFYNNTCEGSEGTHR